MQNILSTRNDFQWLRKITAWINKNQSLHFEYFHQLIGRIQSKLTYRAEKNKNDNGS